VSREIRYSLAAARAMGLALLALGIVYLTVECRSLPGVLGGTRGDTSPRTGLGVLCVVLGLGVLLATLFLSHRRPPSPPRHS
jgi:hypothetical protein